MTRSRSLTLTLIFLQWCLVAFAQIENVIVETYYISNAADATDTLGGHLEEGSITYRVFVDLMPGSKILRIYGDEAHPLVFTSTAPFFNNHDGGISFGKDLVRTRYGNGTNALDTYLTLGQCSKAFSQGAYFGFPKMQDTDGSIVGGANNDGGSAEIPEGLLINDTEQIGIPITDADGMVFNNDLPDGWIDIGFKDLFTGLDTTIFGSDSALTSFRSTQALLRNSGVRGVNPDENIVFVAQLTTKGDISFEINLEVEIEVSGEAHIVKYVAQNEQLSHGEIFIPLLNYPYTCGCTDPHYLEANTSFVCSDNSKCLTPIVFGCTDTLACNYSDHAKFNVPELCCYVGYCHDLDIGVVCPTLTPRATINQEQVRLFPNPTSAELHVEIDFVIHNAIPFILYDTYGRIIKTGLAQGPEKEINISELCQGMYLLQLEINHELITRPFVKI